MPDTSPAPTTPISTTPPSGPSQSAVSQKVNAGTTPPPPSNTSKTSLRKKRPMKMIVGMIILILLLVGAAAAYFLTQTNQDVRQQAAPPDYCAADGECIDLTNTECCTGTVKVADSSCKATGLKCVADSNTCSSPVGNIVAGESKYANSCGGNCLPTQKEKYTCNGATLVTNCVDSPQSCAGSCTSDADCTSGTECVMTLEGTKGCATPTRMYYIGS